ncbi:DNA primase large subunit [Cryptococcus wingfieldii CBS 7118]|uniref:DNA primase large subunit n=1 Tax=Cryptococcus wingfieldii CBS 7118 TaxID=1295528 RepID=A0A1E3K6J0_9TREE|nr:DNA primase large subunit [Cryptococcus wingfieldii CBS 7118]ODO08615.1 DNA primase large subunit [Cryptococcus wingfieldii CBS 7118]
MFRPALRQSSSSSYAAPEVKLSKRGHNTRRDSPYPYRLNLYERPPSLDITLEEFEACAIARLRVLSYIESLSHRSLQYTQFASQLDKYSKTHIPLASSTAKNENLDDQRRRDEIGHWVLRLAFCRSPDLRQRYIRAESQLFRSRFESDDKQEREAFLDSVSFGYDKVDDAEKAELATQLKAMTSSVKGEHHRNDVWYKVPWYNVPDLVGSRKVFIKGGFAYVPQSLQFSLVLQLFCDRLEKALEFTAKNLPRLDEDERLGPVIDHLVASFLSGIGDADYQPAENAGDTITADTIDEVARKHFPPCMRHLYDSLKRDNHLKHYGRLQLTLFIKGLGVPLDQAIIFWRRGYGPKMTDDDFNKNYKYNIRHSYGQEGKRANYPPKDCQTILTQNQPNGSQENHGCPFRHFSPDNLTTFLSSTYPDHFTRSSPAMKEIIDSVKGSHFHVACTRVFEVTHGVNRGEGLGNGESVSHPNKWADRSREMEKEAVAAVQAKVEESIVVDQ